MGFLFCSKKRPRQLCFSGSVGLKGQKSLMPLEKAHAAQTVWRRNIPGLDSLWGVTTLFYAASELLSPWFFVPWSVQRAWGWALCCWECGGEWPVLRPQGQYVICDAVQLSWQTEDGNNTLKGVCDKLKGLWEVRVFSPFMKSKRLKESAETRVNHTKQYDSGEDKKHDLFCWNHTENCSMGCLRSQARVPPIPEGEKGCSTCPVKFSLNTSLWTLNVGIMELTIWQLLWGKEQTAAGLSGLWRGHIVHSQRTGKTSKQAIKKVTRINMTSS